MAHKIIYRKAKRVGRRVRRKARGVRNVTKSFVKLGAAFPLAFVSSSSGGGVPGARKLGKRIMTSATRDYEKGIKQLTTKIKNR